MDSTILELSCFNFVLIFDKFIFLNDMFWNFGDTGISTS